MAGKIYHLPKYPSGLGKERQIYLHYNECRKNFCQGLMAMSEILEHTDLASILTPEIWKLPNVALMRRPYHHYWPRCGAAKPQLGPWHLAKPAASCSLNRNIFSIIGQHCRFFTSQTSGNESDNLYQCLPGRHWSWRFPWGEGGDEVFRGFSIQLTSSWFPSGHPSPLVSGPWDSLPKVILCLQRLLWFRSQLLCHWFMIYHQKWLNWTTSIQDSQFQLVWKVWAKWSGKSSKSKIFPNRQKLKRV